MDRRQVLKYVGLLLGGTMVSNQLFLAACSSENRRGSTFSEVDIDFLNEISEIIIPTTDTPGAKAADVGSFIELMIPDCYTEKDQKSFHDGLIMFRDSFQQEYGHSFMEGKADERRVFLGQLDVEMKVYTGEKSESDPEHYFRILKELVLLGYFTSEIGCTEALRYLQTPGRYESCIDYVDGERAWMYP